MTDVWPVKIAMKRYFSPFGFAVSFKVFLAGTAYVVSNCDKHVSPLGGCGTVPPINFEISTEAANLSYFATSMTQIKPGFRDYIFVRVTRVYQGLELSLLVANRYRVDI